MQEASDAFREMPGWVQAFLALFVLTFLWALISPWLTRRRVRDHFAKLARSLHTNARPGQNQFEASFPMRHNGREFTVRRELRLSPRGSSYRGPRGHVLVIETPLSGSRWKMHNVDVAPRRALARLGIRPVPTGDDEFDARLTVWQDGVPVRDNWLDEATRTALSRFFALPSVGRAGTVWAQEGNLLYENPKAIEKEGLTTIVAEQAALAAALEKTGGWRGPAF